MRRLGNTLLAPQYATLYRKKVEATRCYLCLPFLLPPLPPPVRIPVSCVGATANLDADVKNTLDS